MSNEIIDSFDDQFKALQNAVANLMKDLAQASLIIKNQNTKIQSLETVVAQVVAENDELNSSFEECQQELHYPDHWDTVAYPTFLTALKNLNYIRDNECHTYDGGINDPH